MIETNALKHRMLTFLKQDFLHFSRFLRTNLKLQLLKLQFCQEGIYKNGFEVTLRSKVIDVNILK